MQFNINYDGDSISIYNINSTDRSQNLITRLFGTDQGPLSESTSFSYWEKKVISASSNNMIVEFKSDNYGESTGFSAKIQYTSLNNTMCESWMDMNNKMMQSPNYPNLYHNDIFCNHLITVQPDFHITLYFLEFDVSFYHCSFLCYSPLLS